MKFNSLWAVTALLVLLLVGCAPAEAEPAAPANTAAPALSTVEPTEPADEIVPTPLASPEDEAETNTDQEEAAAEGAVSPVEVDLSEITPETNSEEPREAPMPGIPNARDRLVDKAKDDLAGRLDLDATAIETVEIRSTEWRDGSLGCPAPGMMYTQALVSGYKITLAVADKTYEYHTDQQSRVVLCQGGRPAR